MQGNNDNKWDAREVHMWNFLDSAEATSVTTFKLFLKIEELEK